MPEGSFEKSEVFQAVMVEFLKGIDYAKVEISIQDGKVVDINLRQNWKPKEIRQITVKRSSK